MAAALQEAIGAVKAMFNSREKECVDKFKVFVEFESLIIQKIVDISGVENLSKVCNTLLEHDGKKDDNATPADVFECLMKFRAAVTLINDKQCSEKLRETITYNTFYDRYLHPAVELTWVMVSANSTTTNIRNRGPTISKSVGACLLGIGNIRQMMNYKGAPPMKVHSYADLRKVMMSFYDFLAGKTDARGRVFGPTYKKAEDFIMTEAYQKIVPSMEEIDPRATRSPATGDAESTVEKDVTQGRNKRRRISPRKNKQVKATVERGRSSTKSAGLVDDASDEEISGKTQDPENAAGQLWTYNNLHKNEYGAATIPQLLDELKSVEFGENGKMTIDDDDMINFWSSPLVAATFHDIINRRVFVQDGLISI